MAFEQAARGLADLLGIRVRGSGEPRRIRVHGTDPPALLVDLLNALLALHDIEAVALAGIAVRLPSETELEAVIEVLRLRR